MWNTSTTNTNTQHYIYKNQKNPHFLLCRTVHAVTNDKNELQVNTNIDDSTVTTPFFRISIIKSDYFNIFYFKDSFHFIVANILCLLDSAYTWSKHDAVDTHVILWNSYLSLQDNSITYEKVYINGREASALTYNYNRDRVAHSLFLCFLLFGLWVWISLLFFYLLSLV